MNDYTDQLIIVTAHHHRKPVQLKGHDGNWRDITSRVYSFDFQNLEYRIAPDPPEKKVRAWTVEEMHRMIGRSLISKGEGCTVFIACLFKNGNARLSYPEGKTFSPEDLMNGWTMLDGSPCGVVT